MIDFSVIIPAKNEAANISACLHSIARADYDHTKVEVLVIDNGSSDSTCEIARDFGAQVIVDPALNISGLRNLGAEHASGRLLAFIDADCTVAGSWFMAASRYLDEEGIAIFGSAPDVPDNAGWVPKAWLAVRKKSHPLMEVEWLESMNMFIPKEIFHKAGGFDQTLVTCEDYDICQRFRAYGRIVSDQRIIATHHGEAANVAHFFRKERWRATSNYQGLTTRQVSSAEWPSILLPLAQLMCALIGVIFFFAGWIGFIGWSWFVGFVALWQIPLAVLAVTKASAEQGLFAIVQLYYLFNVYFFARGCAVFGVKQR